MKLTMHTYVSKQEKLFAIIVKMFIQNMIILYFVTCIEVKVYGTISVLRSRSMNHFKYELQKNTFQFLQNKY